jgi:hypothetical protein
VQQTPSFARAPAESHPPATAVRPPTRVRLRGAGRPLDPAARARFEGLTGHELSRVRVHDGAAASESARVLQARAFAVGDDIVFGAGEYRPHSSSGERLLAHELAHVVHARSAPGGPKPGIGPADTRAELGAEAFARATVERRPSPLARDVGSWGPVWHLQLDRVTQRGRLEDAAEINIGPRGGDVIDVRSGVDVESDDGSSREPNQFSLEVEGPHAAQMHWLQFLWVELFATMPKGRLQLAGPLPTNTDPNVELTEKADSPKWSLDALGGSSPYYEEGGAHTRTATDLTMFDWPGTRAEDAVRGWVRIRPAGTPHTLVMHLSTYLIQGTRAVYNVQWTSTTTFTMDAAQTVTAGPRTYHVGGAGRVDALPEKPAQADRQALSGVRARRRAAEATDPPAAPAADPEAVHSVGARLLGLQERTSAFGGQHVALALVEPDRLGQRRGRFVAAASHVQHLRQILGRARVRGQEVAFGRDRHGVVRQLQRCLELTPAPEHLGASRPPDDVRVHVVRPARQLAFARQLLGLVVAPCM